MRRLLEAAIKRDLDEKLVLVSGPRQVGKTTLAKGLFAKRQAYFNFDAVKDRQVLMRQAWPRDVDLVVFDELHKMRKWKSWLKGIYDTEGTRPRLLVTGSANLDTFTRSGESLAGRFFSFRLHPFSVAETQDEVTPQEALRRILKFGGFPQPFLRADETFANRWRRSHVDSILREDVLDVKQVSALRTLELLVELLAERVSVPIRYSSLATDLQISPHTVKAWIELLERLYVVFTVRPYTRNVARAILKEPKVYFYDTARVVNDPGRRFENAVACMLLKRQHFLEDTQGQKRGLFYVRDKSQREVDFITTLSGQPEWLVEAKVTDDTPAPALRHYAGQLKPMRSIQVVQDMGRKSLTDRNVSVLRAAEWLASFEA